MCVSRKLPDFGTLHIENYDSFMEESKLEFNKIRESPLNENKAYSDFSILRYIGKGAFGNVFLIKNNSTGLYHAMKAISKEEIIKKRQVNHTHNETIILHGVNCPFIIRLESYFANHRYIYLIMPFISGGDMSVYLCRANRFQENLVQFYGAQIVLGLEYLHFLDILYRDIKPQNVLIDYTGYLKMTDFGFAKVVKQRTYTICGTPEYIAPEVIAGKGYGKAVDWWSLGILLYEMASGNVPFKQKDCMKMFNQAAYLKYKMPIYFSSGLKHLIQSVLQTDLSKRFGNLRAGVDDIKDHKFFRPIIWSSVLNRKMPPPFIPDEQSLIQIEKSVSSYDEEFQDF